MSNIIEGITKDLKAIPKNLKAKAGGMDTKKLVLLNLPYIFVGYFCDKVAWLWRVSEGTNVSDKMMAVMNRFDKLFANPLPSFHPRDLLIGVACGIALRLVVYYKAKNAKKFRQGAEYGSARWGNAKDIEPYMDSVFENNVLLTQTERLMMSGRPKEPKYARNKNILVIGGSGSGKTCFFVKPNLMQMHSSYVVTDPKGTVLVECGKSRQIPQDGLQQLEGYLSEHDLCAGISDTFSDLYEIRRYFNQAAMAEKMSHMTECEMILHEMDDHTALKDALEESNLLINATSVGMVPDVTGTVIPDKTLFHPELTVADVVYEPRETRLLREAREAGCPTFNGMYMLLHQGVKAFHIWTGLDMPVELVREKYFK